MYNELIAESLLREDVMLSICKELGRLVQGYNIEGSDDYVKGTNTRFFMDFNRIRNIPKYQVCTYKQVCVDCQPQKTTKTESKLQPGAIHLAI